MQVNKKQINETIIVFFILFLSLIFLTPGNFGENFNAETWKAWTASKILLEEGKFIDHTFGPLYYTFLTLLNPLDYKYSITSNDNHFKIVQWYLKLEHSRESSRKTYRHRKRLHTNHPRVSPRITPRTSST